MKIEYEGVMIIAVVLVVRAITRGMILAV